MSRIQTALEINAHYKSEDPWGYYGNKHDSARKKILLSSVKEFSFVKALDVGCGNGFITESFPARSIVGVDVSEEAIKEAQRRSANPNIEYQACSLFQLSPDQLGLFDCILITGVLYDQYIGKSLPLVYRLLDNLLRENGILISVHIDEWYLARFPYSRIHKQRYKYREFNHVLEIYRK